MAYNHKVYITCRPQLATTPILLERTSELEGIGSTLRNISDIVCTSLFIHTYMITYYMHVVISSENNAWQIAPLTFNKFHRQMLSGTK